MSVKTAVFVSGGGTNLQALIDARDAGALKSAALSLVVSSKPGVYALERAAAAGIPAETVSRRACASQADFEAALAALLWLRADGVLPCEIELLDLGMDAETLSVAEAFERSGSVKLIREGN